MVGIILVSTIDKTSMSFCVVNKYSKAWELREVTFAIKKVVPILGLTDSMDFLYFCVSILVLRLYAIGVCVLGMIFDTMLPLCDIFATIIAPELGVARFFFATSRQLGDRLGTIPCLISI